MDNVNNVTSYKFTDMLSIQGMHYRGGIKTVLKALRDIKCNNMQKVPAIFILDKNQSLKMHWLYNNSFLSHGNKEHQDHHH